MKIIKNKLTLLHNLPTILLIKRLLWIDQLKYFFIYRNKGLSIELEFNICQTKFWIQFFFSWKPITQRIKIIETYYKTADSATATYRSLRENYGIHNRPITQAIAKIVKKFEETEVVANIESSVYHRFAHSTANIAIVSQNVGEDPNISIPCRSQELGLY